MNIIDVLIIGLILLGALKGYRQGLLGGAVNLIGTLLGFLIASFRYQAVLAWIERYFPVHNWLEPFVYRVVWSQIQSQAQTPDGGVLPKILGGFSALFKSFPGTTGLSSLQSVSRGVLVQAAQNLSTVITDNLLRLMAFGLVFYAVVLLVHLGAGLLLPLLPLGGTLNHGAGLILGGLTAAVVLAVLAGLLSPFLTLGAGPEVAVMKNSYFYPLLVRIFQGLDRMFSLQWFSKAPGLAQWTNILGR
ncbi:Colicin V production, CvpA [Acididesulfobacillus acetoxydans]|uniref:Colicin V production protein n=1 Tax=Acididesulfobacillus acetoxydans TaxID=1561005 RepID=A0A8S0WL31_9FIRM|nr:CvpA family protein [Acididesulfobacillus acetoxydans]CAA7599794.1 Colicin V production, CvpA [Acididesulfobacillus acetoxydans]CEJ07360.1 Colicin V production protein [Acididesulfobacillus acetoxydans]